MRAGGDRLIYTPAREIRLTVYDRLRAASAGYARFGQGRLFPMPFYQIGILLEKQFRAVSFGAVIFGQFRLTCFSGGFSRSLVRSEHGLFAGFVKSVLRKSGVMARTDAQMVNAITGNSTFRRQFDTALTQRLVRQSGLFPAFDNYFTQTLIRENKFFSRLEKAFIRYIAGAKALFSDFEQAVRDKLLANQIPYFDYEGVQSMSGMYPNNQTIEIFGEEVQRPGVDGEGKFTNGSFSNPDIKPPFIPAQSINLVLDNLTELISKCNEAPNSTSAGQLAALVTPLIQAHKIIQRDASGRAKIAPPAAEDYARRVRPVPGRPQSNGRTEGVHYSRCDGRAAGAL
jgi:hypothetical protein